MAGKEILWRFGIDLTPYKQAFQQIADLQSDQADEQKRRQEEEQQALDDYANSIKEIISTATGFTSELEKQSQLIKEISESYRSMAQDARTRLDTEVQASRQVSSRSTGGTASAPDWMTATTQLRANIAQETLSTKQIGDERQRILGLIDTEIDALKQKDTLSTKELASLKQLTLERERQADALSTGANIGVTAGTKQALAGLNPGSILQSLGGAALGGGAVGELGTALIGGIAGGGIVALIQGATEALSGFVSEVHNLVTESDSLANIQNTFEQLSQGIGAQPTQFISDLRQATHGLVDDTQLMTSANRVLLQGLSLTEPQIDKLVGTISTLARMQGKDATESFDLVTRALSSGRLAALAYNVGLDEEAKAQLRVAQTLPETVRAMSEYQVIMDGAERQSAKTTGTVDTLGTKLHQSGVEFGNWLSNLSLSISTSEGANSLADAIGRLMDTLTQNKGPMDGIVDVFSALATAVGAVADGLDRSFRVLQEQYNSPFFTAPHLAAAGSPTLVGQIRSFFSPIPAPATLSPAGSQAIDWAKQALGSDSAIASARQTLEAGAPKPQSTLELQEAQKTAAEKSKIDEQYAQQSFDTEKARIDKLLEMEKEARAAGTEDLKTYLANTEALKRQAEQADEDKIAAQTAARKKSIDAQIAVYKSVPGGFVPPQLLMQQQELQVQQDTQTKAARYKLNLDLLTMNDQLNADQRKANQTAAQALLNDEKSSLDLKKQALDKNFSDGLVSADNYTKQSLIYIGQIESAELDYEAARHALAEKSTAETATNAANVAKIEQDAAKQTQAVVLATLDTIIKAEQDRFNRKRALLEAELATAKTTNNRADEVAILQQLIALDQAQNDEESQILGNLDSTDARYLTIQTHIAQNRDAQMQWNQEIVKTVDILQPMADITGRLSKAVGGMSQSWMQGLSSLSSFIGALSTTQTGLITRMQAQGATNVSAGMGSPAIAIAAISNLVRGTGTERANAISGVDPLTGNIYKQASATENVTEKLSKFGDALEASISAVSGWMQVASGQQGPVAGGVSGAVVGLQTGQAITGGLGSIGALAGAMAGPIGAAIGIGSAIVGGIVGVFSGKAKKKTEEIAKSITDAFNNVTTSLNTGATTLQQAIAQTQQLRANAISTLSGQKGGQDQLDKMLPQMDQTIASLQAKQSQIFKTFDEALVVLRSPEPFRSFTQSVDGLLQKYQDYIDAGGNVALANEFLQRSFEDLQSSVGDQVTTAQTKAIQDALDYNDMLKQQADLVTQLNDLETQRADILNQQSTSIEDILGKGALTRQRTLAMTEGAQVAAVEASTQTQLTALDTQKQNLLDQQDLLNNQIKVSDYRLSIESQMFTIAQNKADIEAQMVTLQEQAADKELDNVKAMQQEMDYMSNAADINALADGGILAAIQGLVNTLTGGTSTTAAPEAPPSSTPKYWTFTLAPWTGSQMPNDMYQNEMSKMIAAQSHGPLQGTDALWLQGLESAVPHYAAGIASVPQDQLAVVHKGETIIPAGASGGNMSAIMEVMMQRVLSESSILNMANQRLKIEAQILSMRMAEINALKDALSSSASTSEMLQGIYGDRGRQSLGGFYGEIG